MTSGIPAPWNCACAFERQFSTIVFDGFRQTADYKLQCLRAISIAATKPLLVFKRALTYKLTPDSSLFASFHALNDNESKWQDSGGRR